MKRLLACALLAAALGCVAKPEATRSGGTACTRDETCNAAPACGEIHLCVQGFCADDTVFRACGDGGYRDATPAGECVTYVSCNTASCGSLVNCVEGRCDREGPHFEVPCDAGED